MANTKGRNYSRLTIKQLYALSGNQCAFPECEVMFLNWEDDTNFSNICHIEDANQSTHKADRYNPNMTDAERADYNNLLLLCPNHHIETNDPNKCSVTDLKKMKRDHETMIRERLVGQNLISKHPSVLNKVISLIGSQLFDNNLSEEPISAPDPEEKIRHNNVQTYKPIIEAYKVYQGKLNKVYQEIENQGSTKKEFVLKNINTLYLREKGKYKGFDQIRESADVIFRNVENELWNRVKNLENELPLEVLEMSILVVMVDAFMRCEILEEPPKK